jgi:hypothetical protein
MEFVYLADWVRNTIDKCEVLSKRGARVELRRPRSQPVNMLIENGHPMAQIKLCNSYKESLDWIKEKRLAQIEKIKGQLAIANKRLTEVVKYYE